jgi:MFS transporter, BCD family, chlorophyll transporter
MNINSQVSQKSSSLGQLWNQAGINAWKKVGPRFLPFADAASDDLPMSRLLRLSLFQVSVGLCTALMIGTLNRVLIIELGVASWIVALMVALPILASPFRAFMGYRSDTHRSVLGWRRVPYIWSGSLLQFGGLAIMPFALILLSQAQDGAKLLGQCASAAAFLMVGIGLQITQTAGLALATDLAPEQKRPRVVALMYVMLLIGMLVSGLVFSALLANFSNTRLVQVVQGAAVMTVLLNLVASWKQEPRRRQSANTVPETGSFSLSWQRLISQPEARRYLIAVGLGSAAFAMQDIILEPYGAEILGLTVSSTTLLTAVLAGGAVCAYLIAARFLNRGANPHRIAAAGLLVGLPAFSLVIFAEPFGSSLMFRIGAFLIGMGTGLFSVATLAAAMRMDMHAAPRQTNQGLDAPPSSQVNNFNGLALGAWGAANATCTGLAIALGGGLRDFVGSLASNGALGSVLAIPATGYSFVYHLEIMMLLVALVVIGPLARFSTNYSDDTESKKKFGLSELPN